MKITISIVCYAVYSSFNTKSEEVSEAWSTPDKLEELNLEKFWQIQWRRPYQGYFFFQIAWNSSCRVIEEMFTL